MKILTIQDISCYGQCSISVALPILSSYGIETAFLPSAILSTHTGGFEGFEVFDFTEPLKKIVAHWKKEKLVFDAIYTGYIAKADQFELILECRKDFLKPGGLFIVDPAMADNGKLYPGLGQDIVEGMRTLCRNADVILPNVTEACFLLDIPWRDDFSEEDIEQMARKLADWGPETVIITGVEYVEDGNLLMGSIGFEKSKDELTGYYALKRPTYHGTGDVFSSIIVASLLKDKPLEEALEAASTFVIQSIEKTLPDASHPYGVKFEEVLDEQREH